MNIEHLGRSERRLVFPGVDAVHGANIHARGIFRADAGLTNNIRHRSYYYNRWQHMTSVLRRAALIAAVVLGATVRAAAQVLPSEPIALAGGRVTIAGDVSASAAPE